jgi:predicted RNase H-like HicB family nuclease
MESAAAHQPTGILRASTPEALMATFKIIVEKHADGYLAYPLGVSGTVIGQGESYEAALADVRSAIAFHLETFGTEALECDTPVLEAFVAEADIAG